MYFSRIALNEARISTRQLLSSPFKVHAAIEAAFPPESLRRTDEGRILWRVDSLDQPRQTWLYTLSPEKPDFTHIVEQAGWPTRAEWETKDYSPRLDGISVGQQWAFRLRANPTRTVWKDHGVKENPAVIGKVMGHVTVSQQLQWLVDRSERNGFALLSLASGEANNSPIPACTITNRAIQRFEHRGSKVTLTTAQFDGFLEVTDADLFRKTLGFGLGRAKGFGCGLMTIAPFQSNSSFGPKIMKFSTPESQSE